MSDQLTREHVLADSGKVLWRGHELRNRADLVTGIGHPVEHGAEEDRQLVADKPAAAAGNQWCGGSVRWRPGRGRRWPSKIRQARVGPERCLWKWLRRSNIPISGFPGGAKKALGSAK